MSAGWVREPRLTNRRVLMAHVTNPAPRNTSWPRESRVPERHPSPRPMTSTSVAMATTSTT